MDAFIQRAIEEHSQIADRTAKLEAFLPVLEKQEDVSKHEYSVAVAQYRAMSDYKICLEERLSIHGIEIVTDSTGKIEYYEKAAIFDPSNVKLTGENDQPEESNNENKD